MDKRLVEEKLSKFDSAVEKDGYLWFYCKICGKKSRSSIPFCVVHGG